MGSIFGGQQIATTAGMAFAARQIAMKAFIFGDVEADVKDWITERVQVQAIQCIESDGDGLSLASECWQWNHGVL